MRPTISLIFDHQNRFPSRGREEEHRARHETRCSPASRGSKSGLGGKRRGAKVRGRFGKSKYLRLQEPGRARGGMGSEGRVGL